MKSGDKVMRINQINKNRKGGRLDKYTDQNIYTVQKTLSNVNIQIPDMHSNKTSLPTSHLKKYTTPQSTTFPESPSTITHIPTNQSSTLPTHVPISSPSQKTHSSPQSKFHTVQNEPMKPCLKTNIHTQNSQDISNPNNSTSCQHLKEDELPNLINVNLQNVSQNNKENSSPSHILTFHSKQKVGFSNLNQVYNISPKKFKKSHNRSSILQTEAIHKLHEALKPIKKNTQLHYTHKSNTQSNEHIQSHCSEHENNIFQDDIIITKQEGPTIYIFHPLTLESHKNISPLMHIQEVEPQCTTKFNGIGSPLIGPPK